MKAIILCAGYATRLYPLTETKAKPLIEIKGKPIVEHIVDQLLYLAVVTDIQLVVNNKFFKDFEAWKEKQTYSERIKIFNNGSSDVSDARGAIGDFFFALEQSQDDDVLLIAGDNYFDFNLCFFTTYSQLQFHHPVIAVYSLKDKRQASQFGIISTNRYGKVTWFEEKPQNPKSTLASIGLYYIPKQALSLIDQYKAENNPKDQIGHFIGWLTQNTDVLAYPVLGKWYDIGSKEILKAANSS